MKEINLFMQVIGWWFCISLVLSLILAWICLKVFKKPKNEFTSGRIGTTRYRYKNEDWQENMDN